jgi:hypothetical protein
LRIVPPTEPAWRNEGWHPLASADSYRRNERLCVTGNFRDEFPELYLPQSEAFDPNSPILLREHPGKPDFFEITFLRSNPLTIFWKSRSAKRVCSAQGDDHARA